MQRPSESNMENTSLLRIFNDVVRCYGSQLAVEDIGRNISYKELDLLSSQWAAHLQQSNYPDESVIALCLERSLDTIVSIISILKAGYAYLPIDPEYPDERIQYILENSSAVLVLTQGRLINRIEDITDVPVIDIQKTPHYESDEYKENSDIKATRLVYVIYTSGSTGRPKGVEIEEKGLINLVNWHTNQFNLAAFDRHSFMMAPGFDASVYEIWPAILSGGCLVLTDKRIRASHSAVQQWLYENRITISLVPTVIAEKLIRADWKEDCSLRALMCGGDALNNIPKGVQPFDFYNLYGPSEDTVCTTACKIQGNLSDGGRPSIGKPITNTACYILDENDTEVPDGEKGELFITGAGLARGYRGSPELTKARFQNIEVNGHIERAYKTGDCVYKDSDGNLHFVGRLDHQVKVRGHRIELGEIENTLQKHHDVSEAVVCAKKDGLGNNRLIAYMLSEQRDNSAIREHLDQYLPDYMQPSAFVFLDTFPLTANGKVDRNALLKIETIDSGTASVDFDDRTLNTLAKLWFDNLRNYPDDEHQRFFDAGGDSLSIESLACSIESRFDITIQPGQLFEYDTLDAQKRLVAEAIKFRKDHSQLDHTYPVIISGFAMEEERETITVCDYKGNPQYKVTIANHSDIDRIVESATHQLEKLHEVPLEEIRNLFLNTMERFIEKIDNQYIAAITGSTETYLSGLWFACTKMLKLYNEYLANMLPGRFHQGDNRAYPKNTAPTFVILPGNSEMESIWLILQVLMTRNPVVVRVSTASASMYVIHTFLGALTACLANQRTLLREVLNSISVIHVPSNSELMARLYRDGWNYIIFGQEKTTLNFEKTVRQHALPRKVIRYGNGFSTSVIFHDSVVDDAAKKVFDSIATNRGYECVSTDVLYVEQDIYDEFLTALRKYLADYNRYHPEKHGVVLPRNSAYIVNSLTDLGFENDITMVTDHAGNEAFRSAILEVDRDHKPKEYPGTVITVRSFNGLDELQSQMALDLDANQLSHSLVTSVYTTTHGPADAIIRMGRARTIRVNKPTHQLDVLEPHQGIDLYLELVDLNYVDVSNAEFFMNIDEPHLPVVYRLR